MSLNIFDHYADRIIHPPAWMFNGGLQYVTLMGSQAYAVSSDNSDNDYYGFAIPPREFIFPSQFGEIEGFGTPLPRFEQWSEHHIINPRKPDITNDYAIYNITKYFHLCMDCNPNMIDSLYTPERCVQYCSPIARRVREKRNIFLHKGSWHRFRGYAYSQIAKIKNKTNSTNPKRKESIEKFGYDVKYGYHLTRLLLEVEQILQEHTIDLERSNEVLKSIRRGEWTLEYLLEWFKKKETSLEEVYSSSTLRVCPDEKEIKSLLMECLEEYYGNLQCANLEENELISRLKSKLDTIKSIANSL